MHRGIAVILLGMATVGCSRGVVTRSDPYRSHRQEVAVEDGATVPADMSGAVVTELATTQPASVQPEVQETQPEVHRDQTFILAAGDKEWSRVVLDQVLERAAPLLETNEQGVDGGESRRIRQLEKLAEQCRVLQKRLVRIPEQLELFSLELQIRHAVALEVTDLGTTDKRISGLRDTAESVKGLDGIEAAELARYWLLQADLLAMRVQGTVLDDDQYIVISRLEGFLQRSQLGGRDRQADISDEAAVNPAVFSMLRAVKWALLHLYDQVGMNGQACELAQQLKTVRYRLDGGDGRGDLERVLGCCKLLGQRFEARVRTDVGEVWSSDDHRGGPILLHFWAPWAKPSTKVIDHLSQQYAQLHDRGLNVLSIQLGCRPDVRVQPLSVDWATCSQSDGSADLAKLFQVTSLPRFAMIDGEGYIVAIGSTLGILRAIDGLDDSDIPGDDPTPTDRRTPGKPKQRNAPRLLLEPSRPIQQSAAVAEPAITPAAE